MGHRCIICDWSPNVPSVSNPTAKANTIVAGTDYCDVCYGVILTQLAYWRVVDRDERRHSFVEPLSLSLRQE